MSDARFERPYLRALNARPSIGARIVGRLSIGAAFLIVAAVALGVSALIAEVLL